MANIAALLARILTTRYGRDMRQALHDSIEAVNNDTETALGKTLAFDDTTRKLTLKAKDNSVLSEATISGGTSGSTVAWNQIKQSGEKIATITIDETTTDVYASAGGGGGGGAVDTVNGIAPDSNGNVTVDADHISDTSTTNKFVTATEKSTWNGKQDALTFTSTPSVSNKVVCVNDLPSGGGSNPNLLDNAWFTVNQKGFSSKTVSQTGEVTPFIDGWIGYYYANASSSYMYTANGLKFTVKEKPDGGSYSILGLKQRFESMDFISGKMITLSVKLSNGTILSTSGNAGTSGSNNLPSVAIESGVTIQLTVDFTNQQLVFKIVNATSNQKEYTIRALKLELSSESTLDLDVEPNYTTELLKCQRYYKRFNCPNAYDMLATGMSYNGASARFMVPLSVPMRTTPTMNVVGGFEVITSANVNYYISSDRPLYMTYLEDRIFLSVACSGISSDGCFLCSASANSYIELTAELTSVA